METRRYHKGSEWRKWDLHVHTSCSVLNNGFGTDWDLYVRTLFNKALEQGIAVIGITDYFTIDGYKRLKNEYLAKTSKLEEVFHKELQEDPEYITKIRSILILPNIEFRLGNVVIAKKDGGKPRKLNYHVVFSDELSIEDIEEHFLYELEFTYEGNPGGNDERQSLKPSNLERLGKKLRAEHDHFRESFSDRYVGFMTAEVSHHQISSVLSRRPSMFKDKYLLVCTDDVSLMDWDSQAHNIRKVIVQKSHMIFSGNPKTREWALSAEFPKEFKSRKPCIWGSDAHDFDRLFEPDESRCCWIKADPTFSGLRQVLREPCDRVYIGNMPERVRMVSENASKFISSIQIRKTSDSALADIWFDSAIHLNEGLVAIIGRKGSGKSALADTIGLLGNSNREKDFSFLSSSRFRKEPQNLARNFEAAMCWKDGSKSSLRLSDNVDPQRVQRVKYLPQQFIERICNDLTDSFRKEVNKIVFSHLPDDEKLSSGTFDELMDQLCHGIEGKVTLLTKKLKDSNRRIVQLEERMTKEYKTQLLQKLDLKQKEASVHASTAPEQVAPPEYTKETKGLSSRIEDIDSQIERLDQLIVTKETELKRLASVLAQLSSFEAQVEMLRDQYHALIESMEPLLSSVDINIYDIFTFTYDEEVVSLRIKELCNAKEAILVELGRNGIETASTGAKAIDVGTEPQRSLLTVKDRLIKDKENLQKELDGPTKRYQKYLDGRREWEEAHRKIVGNADTPDTLEFYEEELRAVEHELPKQLEHEKRVRHELALSIMGQKLEMLGKYARVCKYVNDAIEQATGVQDQHMRFSAEPYWDDFVECFLGFINQAVLGPFRGNEQGREHLKEIISVHNLDTAEGAIGFLDYLVAHLVEGDWNLERQLKPKCSKSEFLDFLYSLDYVRIGYRMRVDGKTLDQLSPGEKGAMLLVFFLVLDKDTHPLIMDQPEENLDNQSVSSYLVPYIKKARSRRQVIIVTHNPNIAVVSDADQIICADIDREASTKVTYVSGSIEDPMINRKVVDVLEGTMPAFNNRKEKYYPPMEEYL